MKYKTFDFYDKTSLKSYNLDQKMQYQLNILDTLDVYTRKHCENVASLTCRMCEYLHCKKGFTQYCTICAYLHDIGKIYIPSNILQKPDKLTEEEFEIIKKHTTLGYEMCMKDLKLRPYAIGAWCHHECLNGTGYPRGLTKKDIPYEAQIIAVADQFDAIVSKRQYKTHIGVSDTLKLLIENSYPENNINRNPISKSAVLSEMKELANTGKLNPAIVKVLIKVIADDVAYEISFRQSYVDDLKDELKRFDKIEQYENAMNKAKKEKDKKYYLDGLNMYLKKDETLYNYKVLYEEHKNAYIMRKNEIENLYAELKLIKKLKV